ncbi:hypothetical protein HPP92_002670 [Vanilla planifolia]|uniref:Uncharacterized protein n=1 Tax=Vanilla planifolia TaxID=51239 RepID=A0A835VMQ1_VANPL|nr:hypothetical protein HPP92_002670 [Vanilla planifolia]
MQRTPYTTNSCTENNRAIEGNTEDATYSVSKDIAKMEDTIVQTQGRSEENTQDETVDDKEVEDDLRKDVESAFGEDLEGSLHAISDEIKRPTKENEEDILKSTDKAEASEQNNLPTAKQNLEQKFSNYKERTDSEEGLGNDIQNEEEQVKEKALLIPIQS